MKTRINSVVILSAATLWLAAGSLLAQTPEPPANAGAGHIERLAILLDLDEGQKVAVKKVFDEQHEQRAALRKEAKESGTRPTREQMQAKHQQMKQETIEKLRPILSDQQLTKFEALTDHPHGPGAQRHREKQE